MALSSPTPSEWAERAVGLLYERGARRVWGFGSFGEGFTLDMHSDIDLAVEGLSKSEIASVETRLRGRGPCKVDVLAVEDLEAQYRWFVARGRYIPPGAPVHLANGSRSSLKQKRLAAVAEALEEAGSRRVLDLGCGPGWLIERVVRQPQVECVLGVDKDERALELGHRRLAARLTREELGRVQLAHGLFTWRDERFAGFDAAVAVEVIEHLEQPQLAAFEGVVFGFARPRTVLVTTPNIEYNELFGLGGGERRHPDHRFEWTRKQFQRWGRRLGKRHGYRFEAHPVGGSDPERGAATQLGSFRREGEA